MREIIIEKYQQPDNTTYFEDGTYIMAWHDAEGKVSRMNNLPAVIMHEHNNIAITFAKNGMVYKEILELKDGYMIVTNHEEPIDIDVLLDNVDDRE